MRNANLSVRIEGQSWATCHAYPDRTPILGVKTPSVYLTLCGVNGESASPEEVTFARELLHAVQTFVEQVEAWAPDAPPMLPLAAGGGEQ